MRKKKEEEKEEEEERKEDFRGIILSIRLCSIITQPRSRRKVNRGNSEYASKRTIERLDRGWDAKDPVEDPVRDGVTSSSPSLREREKRIESRRDGSSID